MNTEFTNDFLKSVKKLDQKSVKLKVKEFIILIENADTLQEIPNIKKMQGYDYFFRWRTGNYRIGFEYKNNTVKFLIVAHRSNIYKIFP